MGFQDVAFLPSRDSFITTFLKHCGRGKSLWIAKCHKTVIGVCKGMLNVKYFDSNRSLFISVE